MAVGSQWKGGKGKDLGEWAGVQPQGPPPATSVRWPKLLSISSHLRGMFLMKRCQSDAWCTLWSLGNMRHFLAALKLPKCCVSTYTYIWHHQDDLCSCAWRLCGIKVHFKCSDFFPSIKLSLTMKPTSLTAVAKIV